VPAKSQTTTRQDSVPFVCRDGLPLDYGAVAEDVWRDFDSSLNKLANEAAFLRGMLKALNRDSRQRGDVPRLPNSKLLPMPVCKDVVPDDKMKLSDPGSGLKPSRLRENRSPRSVRMGKVVVQTFPYNKEIIEEEPGPEKEAPARVRRPFADVNFNASAPFRVRATVG